VAYQVSYYRRGSIEAAREIIGTLLEGIRIESVEAHYRTYYEGKGGEKEKQYEKEFVKVMNFMAALATKMAIQAPQVGGIVKMVVEVVVLV